MNHKCMISEDENNYKLGERKMDHKIFQLLAENIPQPVWIKDLEFRFIYANNEYKKIHKGKTTEFIGLNHNEAFEEAIAKKYNQECKSVIETLDPRTEEGYVDGIYRKCTIFPLINSEGKVVAISGLDSTVSIVKEKDRVIEEQKNLFNVVLDTLPGMIFYKDIEGKYVYANKEYADFNKKNKKYHDVIDKDDLQVQLTKDKALEFIKQDKYVMDNKKAISINSTYINEDGKMIYNEVIKKPVLDNTGKAVGVIGLVSDVTEKKEVEERLRYLSYTDILTGTYNRAYFEEKAKEFLSEEYFPVGVIMGDANGLKVVNDTFGHVEGDNLLKTVTTILKEVCKEKGVIFRVGGDEFIVLVPRTDKIECENIIKEIFNQCEKYKDELINISIALGSSVTDNKDKSIYEAVKEAEDKVYRQKLLKENSISSAIMHSLKTGLEAKSMETEEHAERVLKNAIAIGKKLSLSVAEMDELKLVAKLHDIGKIGISEEILFSHDKLSNEEFDIMKTHTEKGYRIVKASNELDSVAKGVLTHHERWDGNGYPLKLKEKDIPLVARIISVADSYDVMTHDNGYKRAMSKDDAIKELKRCSGSQFDPEIVKIFIEYLKEN